MFSIAIIAGAIVGVFLVVGLILAALYRRVVEPNETHIVQTSKGTVTYGQQSIVNGADDASYGNSYYVWPSWWPVIGVQSVVLPLSVFDQDLTGYEAYDIGKVPFVVDIVAFFRISNAAVAAKRIQSLPELRGQLTSILQGAVRTILAKHDIEEIMMERSTFGKMFTSETAEQLQSWGVINVKDIELMDIRDGQGSKTVSNIMAKKESLIDMQSRKEVAVNQKEAKLAEIDAQREADVRAQEALQFVGERTAEKDKKVGIADQQAMQAIQSEAKLTTERDMAVKQVEEVRTAEIAKDVRIVKAEEQKQVDITESEGQKAQTVLIAEGDLTQQQLNGEGILAVGTADAESKRLGEMALVSPQIELAQEIGDNKGYQTYLVQIRGVEKDEVVGVEQAKALQAAGIKVIANTGDVTTGVSKVMDLFSPKGGTAVGGALEAFANTDQGSALLKKFGMSVEDVAELMDDEPEAPAPTILLEEGGDDQPEA
jgi:flotillin